MSKYNVVYFLTVNYAEGKGAIFLTKEESHQVLGGGHITLSEIDGWEEFYYTNKVRTRRFYDFSSYFKRNGRVSTTNKIT